MFKRKLLELAKGNDLPDISLEVIDGESARPKMKMVMRRHLAEQPSRKRKAPARVASAKDDMVDAGLALGLISRVSEGMRVADRPARASAPTGGARAPSPARSSSASKALDPDIYAAIRADFPGWDYDELMRRFDAFLGENPAELPRNYSKRFYGFVKEHHRRNKYRL